MASSKIDKVLLKHSEKPYLKENDYQRLNLRVPLVRSELKNEFSYNNLLVKEQLIEWDEVWSKSDYFESMSCALYFYQHRTLKKAEYSTIKKWIDRCSCWEHSDDLSKIYAQVVEDNPRWILPELRKWNKSKEPWKRRQSVVSLLEYSQKRKKVQSFATLIGFIKPLLGDSEYYVQKGIGWTMREIYNLYPDQMLKFIQKNLYEISPIAYSASVEKLSKELKLELRVLRKENRKL